MIALASDSLVLVLVVVSKKSSTPNMMKGGDWGRCVVGGVHERVQNGVGGKGREESRVEGRSERMSPS